MATSDVVGSWFPTGYHGHFRNKFRSDFVCEYRQLARPQPPRKYIHRSIQPSRSHVFTHHDNRQAFLNDALIFQLGLGKRRDPNCKSKFKREFMTWLPEREAVERMRPLCSSYRLDFKEDKTSEETSSQDSVPQIFIKRPMTSFDGTPTTTYRYAHGTEAPNKKAITEASRETLNLSYLHRKDRNMSTKKKYRETVASCMIWQSECQNGPGQGCKRTAGRSTVPTATKTVTVTSRTGKAENADSNMSNKHTNCKCLKRPSGLTKISV